MPFCSSCGNTLGPRDFFCGGCGNRQPIQGAPGVYRPAGPWDSISPRAASMLCYVPFLGWIASLFVLGSQKFRQEPTVRFHAFQGLYLFVAWLLVDWVNVPWSGAGVVLFPLRKILKLAFVGLWIFMLVKASQEEKYSLPLIGDLAERSL